MKQLNLLFPKFRKLQQCLSPTAAISILILAATFCTILPSHSSANYRELPDSPRGVKAASVNSKQGCCTQDFDKPHRLASSYYSLKDGLTATLMLNNKGPAPVEVKPTLFSLTGERLDVAPVTVAGESFRNIDLRELGALPGTRFEQGSLQLFHLGPDLVIGAQMYLVDEARSLSFDEKLSEFQTAASTQLESVWWLPSQESITTLILSNTSDSEVTTHTLVQMGNGRAEGINPTLLPHETQLISLKPENSGNKRGTKNQVGSASISHSGPKGAVLARTLVEDSRSGYSFSAQFYSPQGGKSSGYQGVGLRLETPTGEKLNPVVVARNIGDVETYLTGRMPYTTADGRDGVVQLPKIKLTAGEAQSLDIRRVIAKAIASENIGAASLEFEYTTAPGSVVMVAETVSQDGNQVFRVPMWDVPAQRNGTGGYPWFIEGDSSTFVYIKNVTDEEQHFTFSLTYDGGDYSLGVKPIKARQTVAFDLRALRDNQVPDERNQTIPLNATRGKIVWSVRGRNSLALLGRSEQVDVTKGISSSYACFMCCPNSFRFSEISPVGLGLTVTSFTTVRGRERDTTCYGSLTPWYYFGDTWTVDNSSVISSSGTGDAADVTGVGVGSATLTAHWEVFNFTMEHDLNGPYCVESSEMTDPAAPVDVGPHINSISPSRGPVGNTVSIEIFGYGFDPNATKLVNVSGSGVSVSGIGQINGGPITADLNFASDATAGNRDLTVTISGFTSNSVNFFVQVPTRLVPYNHVLAPGGVGPLKTPVNQNVTFLEGAVVFQNFCGVYRSYLFELADQQGQRMQTAFTFDEIFSNVQSSPGLAAVTYTPVNFPANYVAIEDLQSVGFVGGGCLSNNQLQTFTQQFRITIGQTAYFPTTTINITRGNQNGTLVVNRTITTP